MRKGNRLRRILAALSGVLAVSALGGCEPRYGALRSEWTAATGGIIAATPAVGNGRAYIGSWDGYEYAFDEATGTRRWRTFLGQAPHPACGTQGVTSSPALLDGVAYLGGGNDKWYALNETSGSVLWSVPTGSFSTGHYNWSSPAVHNGHAYVGIASLCDSPLVQGKLLRVNLATHQIVNTWKVVPDGQLGGTIWTKPVVDAARNTIFVTTGNRAYDSTGNTQLHAEALVAVDSTTLAIKGYWSLPVADPTPDADWGTSPTLSRDSLGRDLVSAANKNGIVYTFLRDNVSAGPVWSRRVAAAATGSDPAAGGVYSNGFFDGQRIFYASGETTIGGKTVAGAIRALDPRTGAIIWERALPSRTYGALTGANGMLVVPSRTALRLVAPATGEILYENPLSLYAAATVANGRLFIGDLGGTARAYTYPASPGATAATTAPLQVALARGCQPIQELSPALAGTAVRITEVRDAAPGPVSVELHEGDCSGRPLRRARLHPGKADVLRLPRALPAHGRLSVASSRPVRLKLALLATHHRR